MRLLAVFLLAAAFPWASLADALLPRDVVKTAIIGASEDRQELFLKFVDLASIQAQTNQLRSAEKVVQLLKGIDLKLAEMDSPRGEWKEGARTTVAMSSPLKLRFVVKCTGLPDGEPRWKIVEIYYENGKD